MKSKRLFYKELRFLKEEYNFEYVIKSKGIDERYSFKKNNFEIGFFTRTEHLDYTCHFYYSLNGIEIILDIDEEFDKLFAIRSRKNYFWQLGMIVKEQLKRDKIFNHHI